MNKGETIIFFALDLICSTPLSCLTSSISKLVNPASMKQALVHTARRLTKERRNIFEQGQGMLDLMAAAMYLDSYTPQATLVPPRLDTTDCPYMWPYCAQGLYYSAQPLVANVTILNGLGVVGYLDSAITWHPSPASAGDMIDVSASLNGVLWPWTGSLTVRVAVKEVARSLHEVAEGEIRFSIVSPLAAGMGSRRAELRLPLRIQVVPTPPRRRRLLWDGYHSLAYPPGYIPRDDLMQRSDPLDWNGDHPHTNFRTLFQHLRRRGYFVEILTEPWTCFDPRNYAALLLVDSEEEFFDEEIAQLRRAVNEHGLSLFVVADWYSTATMEAVRFYDDNTRNWWFPETGGANVPALNELLKNWDIALGGHVLHGRFTYRSRVIEYRSGSSIVSFPAGGKIVSAMLVDQSGGSSSSGNSNNNNNNKNNNNNGNNNGNGKYPADSGSQGDGDGVGSHGKGHTAGIGAGSDASDTGASSRRALAEEAMGGSNAYFSSGRSRLERAPILGLYEVPVSLALDDTSYGSRGPGRIAVYGDSGCLDDSHSEGAPRCVDFVDAVLAYLDGQDNNELLAPLLEVAQLLEFPLAAPASALPQRSPRSTLHLYSAVVTKEGGRIVKRPLPPCRAIAWTKVQEWDAAKIVDENQRLLVEERFDHDQGGSKAPEAFSSPSAAAVVDSALVHTPGHTPRQGLEAKLAPGVPREPVPGHFVPRPEGGNWAGRHRWLSSWRIVGLGMCIVGVLVLLATRLRRRRDRSQIIRSPRPVSSGDFAA